ncbi:MAG: hypothetical protein ACXIU2_13325, partial [Cyclobacteriaceae bacterium]
SLLALELLFSPSPRSLQTTESKVERNKSCSVYLSYLCRSPLLPSENPSAMCGFRTPIFGFQKAGSK